MEAEILEASVNNAAGQAQSDRDSCQMRTQGSGIMSATVHWSPALNTVGKRVDEVDDEDDDEDSDADDNASDDDASIGANHLSASGSHDILYLLEQWDEPKNVMDKVSILDWSPEHNRSTVAHLRVVVSSPHRLPIPRLMIS